jgi:hypothetical protein
MKTNCQSGVNVRVKNKLTSVMEKSEVQLELCITEMNL